jgi:hypothetical protein
MVTGITSDLTKSLEKYFKKLGINLHPGEIQKIVLSRTVHKLRKMCGIHVKAAKARQENGTS